jgi:hypothetical protein
MMVPLFPLADSPTDHTECYASCAVETNKSHGAVSNCHRRHSIIRKSAGACASLWNVIRQTKNDSGTSGVPRIGFAAFGFSAAFRPISQSAPKAGGSALGRIGYREDVPSPLAKTPSSEASDLTGISRRQPAVR